MILKAFHISHSLNTKGDAGSEKTYSSFIQIFYSPNTPVRIKNVCNDYITCQLNKPYPNQQQLAEKQDFKGETYISTTRYHLIQKALFRPLQKEIIHNRNN